MKDLLSILGCRPSNHTRALHGTSRPAKSEEDGPSHGPHNATRDETYAQDVNSHASRQAEAPGMKAPALPTHEPCTDSSAVLHALGATSLHRQHSTCIPTVQQHSPPHRSTSTPDQHQHLQCSYTSPGCHSSPHRQGPTNAPQTSPQEEDEEGDVLAHLISSLEDREGDAHGGDAAGRHQFLLHKDSTCSSSERVNMGSARREGECDVELAEAMKLVESLMPKSTYEEAPSPTCGQTSPCALEGTLNAPATESHADLSGGPCVATASKHAPTPPSSKSTPLGCSPHPPPYSDSDDKHGSFLSRSAASFPSLCPPSPLQSTPHVPTCVEVPLAAPLYARPVKQAPPDPKPYCPISSAGAAGCSASAPLLATPLQASASAPLLAGPTPASSFASLPDIDQQHPAASATQIPHLPSPYGFGSKQEDCLAAAAAVAAATAIAPGQQGIEGGMGLPSSLPLLLQQQHLAAVPFAPSSSAPAQAMQDVMWEEGMGMGQLSCSFPPTLHGHGAVQPAPQTTQGRRWGAKHLHKDQAVVDAILQRKKPPKPPTHNKRATPFEVPAFSLPGLDAAYWIPGASHSPFQQGAAPATQHQHKGKSSLSLSLDHVQSAPLSETSPTSNETPSPLKRTMMQQGGEGGSSSAARVSLQALPKRPRNTSISISSYDTNASSDSGDENSGRTSSKSKGSNRGGRGRGVKAGSMDKRPYRRKSDSCAQGKGRTTAARRNSTSAVSGLAGAGTRREPRPEGILGGIYDFVAQEQRKAQQSLLGPMMALSQVPQVPPVPHPWAAKRAASANFPFQPSFAPPLSSQPNCFHHSASWHGGQANQSMEDTAFLVGCGAGTARTDLGARGRSLTPLLPDFNNGLRGADQMAEGAPGDAWAAMFDEES